MEGGLVDINEFILCPPFIRLEKLNLQSCKIYLKDNLIGLLTAMDTYYLETASEFMLDVGFVVNENTSCQLLYLIEQQELKDWSDNVLTILPFEKIDGIVDLSNLNIASQTVYISQLGLKKCNLHHTYYYRIYDDIISAYNANYAAVSQDLNLTTEKSLNKIEKAYLYYLLIESKKDHTVCPMHFFNLDSEWEKLKHINFLLNGSSLKVKVDLVNRGLLFYLNVNSCIIDAVIQKKWESLKSLLDYYESSHLLKYDIIKLFIKKYTDAIPEVLFKRILSLKYKKSPLRKCLYKRNL